MRHFIFASHHRLAEGLKDTVQFLTGDQTDIHDLCCYLDGDSQPVEEKVSALMEGWDPEDEVVILADLLGGSVYQKFYPYLNEHRHLLCGMNLPLAMTLVLEPEGSLTSQRVNEIVNEARNALVYVNDLSSDDDEEDE